MSALRLALFRLHHRLRGHLVLTGGSNDLRSNGERIVVTRYDCTCGARMVRVRAWLP